MSNRAYRTDQFPVDQGNLISKSVPGGILSCINIASSDTSEHVVASKSSILAIPAESYARHVGVLLLGQSAVQRSMSLSYPIQAWQWHDAASVHE
jgi:hypothetical protein